MSGSRRIEPRRRRNSVICTFAALLLGVIASLASSQRVASQQSPITTTKPAGTEIEPRGRRDVKEVTYGDWKKLCFKPGGAKTLCRTSITGTFATGQVAIRVDIVERAGDATARLQIFSPVGMYLQKPVKLTIGQGQTYSVPYTWCLTNACIAGAAANPQMIKEMTTGQSLRLEFVDSSLLTLTTSLPLSQFAAVYRGSPAQTFEQDIDE